MPHKRIDSYSGPEAFNEARKKAKFGHHDWITWIDKDGTRQARRVSQAAMKECLLAVGTKGKWWLICASDGVGMIGFWQMGLAIFNRYKYGYA
jgi:hypothetical protein